MAPSRARSARPSASQRLALRPEAGGILARQMRTQPPSYQAPKYPLSAASQRKLQALAHKYQRRNLAIKHAAAIKQLGECAHDLGEDLNKFEERVERQKKKAEKDPTRANVEEWEEKLAAHKPRHENLAKRLEKYARTCVDLTRRHNALVWATERSAEAAPLGMTQGARGSRYNNTQVGGMSSFEPTLPGTTEGGAAVGEESDTTMAEVASTLDKFKTRRQQEMDMWTTKSLYDRYAGDKGYANFRADQYEGYHGDEEEVPPPSKWFETEEPAPGTATQGAADESDDDIQVARSKISTKCPLTLQEFKDPVMSTVCKHTFEKSAIYEMIGWRPQVQCPVGGCPKYITRAQLEPNDKLLRKIRRIQQSRNRHHQEIDDDDAPRGTNADTSILLSDEPDAGGFQSLDVALNLKQERRSQARRHRGSARDDDVTDEDTDDE